MPYIRQDNEQIDSRKIGSRQNAIVRHHEQRNVSTVMIWKTGNADSSRTAPEIPEVKQSHAHGQQRCTVGIASLAMMW